MRTTDTQRRRVEIGAEIFSCLRPWFWSRPHFPAQDIWLPRRTAPVQLARVGFLVGHRGCFHDRPEQKTVWREINLKRSRPLESTLNESFRQWVFDVFLQRAPERPRAIISIATSFFENPLARFRRQCNLHLAMYQSLVDLTDEQIDNPQQVVIRERVEQDHFIEPVQKFRIKNSLHF